MLTRSLPGGPVSRPGERFQRSPPVTTYRKYFFQSRDLCLAKGTAGRVGSQSS